MVKLEVLPACKQRPWGSSIPRFLTKKVKIQHECIGCHRSQRNIPGIMATEGESRYPFMSSSNRRADERIPVHLQMMVNGRRVPMATLLDLSDGGARVDLPTSFEQISPDETIELSVALPFHSEALFQGEARVIWQKQLSHGKEVGIRWSESTAARCKAARERLINEI